MARSILQKVYYCCLYYASISRATDDYSYDYNYTYDGNYNYDSPTTDESVNFFDSGFSKSPLPDDPLKFRTLTTSSAPTKITEKVTFICPKSKQTSAHQYIFLASNTTNGFALPVASITHDNKVTWYNQDNAQAKKLATLLEPNRHATGWDLSYSETNDFDEFNLACALFNEKVYVNCDTTETECASNFFRWWTYSQDSLNLRYKLDYCLQSERFVRSIVKNVEEKTLVCIHDNTYLPYASNYKLQYHWTLDKRDLPASSSNELPLRSVNARKDKKISCTVTLIENDPVSEKILCAGSSPIQSVYKIIVSDFFGKKKTNTYLFWTGCTIMVASILIGIAACVVYRSNVRFAKQYNESEERLKDSSSMEGSQRLDGKGISTSTRRWCWHSQ